MCNVYNVHIDLLLHKNVGSTSKSMGKDGIDEIPVCESDDGTPED
jgi:hypothetical protein